MKEQVNEKVPRTDRMKELLAVMETGTSKTNPNRYSISPLMRYIAEQVQLAYQAGQVNEGKCTELGNESVEYSKLKGFLI